MHKSLKSLPACAYLLPVAVFAVTLRAAETRGGLRVVLARATCAIMFIACVCVAVTLTPAIETEDIQTLNRRKSKHSSKQD